MTADKLHHYRGKEIEVAFDARRCIHAAECVRNLPGVFDTARRPWVAPDNADARRVAEIVRRCPTGALHYRSIVESAAEQPDAVSSITATRNGPLYARGEIAINDSAGNFVLRDTRVALCRCGATRNPPFCDRSHAHIGFLDSGVVAPSSRASDAGLVARPEMVITPSKDGPLLVTGTVEVCGSVGGSKSIRKDPVFCRCGASGAKPFCDGSHHRIEFKAD